MIFKEIKEYSYIYSIILAYIIIGWCIATYYDVADQFSLLIYSKVVFASTFVLAVLFFLFIILRIMIVDRPDHLTKTIIHDFTTKWVTPQRIVRSIPIIFTFMLFMAAFTSVKSMIPVISAYGYWDVLFYDWDKFLHFGIDPWLLIQPILGHPIATFIINFFYNLWFPVMIGVLYWQAFTLKRLELRKRFFLSFFLCWIINGSILATIFSSVGPTFYGNLYGDANNPFADQLAYLNLANETFPIWALETQSMLWRVYEQNSLNFGSGISAMPSLHVSIALLQVFVGYQVSEKLGRFFLLFFFIILVGSVHLAWHYAIDGYVSILTTSLIWWACGKIEKSATDHYPQPQPDRTV